MSVTDLQAFRRYRLDEDLPLGVLLQQLRRAEPPTVNMTAGTAFHSILENAPEKGISLRRVTVDGFRFSFADLNAEIELAPVREVRGTKDYDIEGELVTLSGRVDGLHGLAVDDHKLTFSPFDAVRYSESYQWRCYLDMFEAERFNYNVFTADLGDVGDGKVIPVKIREFHRLTLYTYPRIHEDVLAELRLYVEFARVHLYAGAA